MLSDLIYDKIRMVFNYSIYNYNMISIVELWW